MTEDRECPVLDYRFNRGPEPAGSNFVRLDEIQRGMRPYFRSSEQDGYWVFTDHDVILEALQNPDVFSSGAPVPIEPDPSYKWIPMMLDPPEHGKWRHLLGLYFSP
jgi:cytochrome P450